MKQKSIFLSLLAIMMVAILSGGLAACDSDDDDSGSSSTGVVGTWSGTIDGDEKLTLTFKKDGTGTWTSRYYDSYSGMETERGSFEYEMEGKSKGIIYVKYYDSYYGYDYDYLYFEIEGKRMLLFEDYYDDDYLGSLTKE